MPRASISMTCGSSMYKLKSGINCNSIRELYLRKGGFIVQLLLMGISMLLEDALVTTTACWETYTGSTLTNC